MPRSERGQQPEPPEHPAVLRVWPTHPERYPDEYVPGVGLAGSVLPWDEAQGWLEAGLVTTTPPEESEA